MLRVEMICFQPGWPSSRHCDEWVTSLFRPSEVKRAERAMENHLNIKLPENTVLYSDHCN